jgi:ABC-type lipoprotein release transport system permease subunit
MGAVNLRGCRPVVGESTARTVILLVIVVVAGASWLPAHRAARVDPLALLRRE